jgi:putative Mg2+ transporter-C (MgtC) family protein
MDSLITELTGPGLKLVAAVCVGALVGVNRDLYGKPAGLRLCALVSLGSALITVITADPHVGLADTAAAARAIQGIVGGIGFLGAGVILHEGGDKRVHNLTTAAIIWMSAALGIACGLGAWRTGGLAAILALLVLTFGLRIDHFLYGRLGPEDVPEGRKAPSNEPPASGHS